MTPSKARLIGFCYKWKFQSIATERNSRVSLCFTQLFLTMSMRLGCCSSNDDLLDGSTEWLIKLAHRCWPPLPTNRIACDAGSDDLLGRICHPVCSVSVTPSKARLIGFCYKWKIQSIATERSIRVSLRSTQLFLTVSMRLENISTNDDLLDGSTERRLTLADVEPSNGLYG